ncbi:Uncharacterised protein [Bergeriella denitrificans]|uniref:Uncharacterized protein n=1 Tax=Bergeriella denitrificans TaxID=494 RepID=A0A378UGZ1_BERDE|nr:Uncharacterised protein [Bergeriella denitrificans]
MIFFGREDGHLDKSQTDYLEKLLIGLFRQTDLKLDNVNSGNTSYIDKTSKIKAQNIWDIVLEIMEGVANIQIFEGYKAENEPFEGTDAARAKAVIELPDGVNISGNSFRENQCKLFQYLLAHPTYKVMVENYVLNGKATSGHCLGTEPNYLPDGQAYTVKLKDGIFLYTHYSTMARRKAIQKFADSVGLDLNILWD